MKKINFIDNEELVIKYLQSQPRDASNTVTLGTKRYSEIKELFPEQFVQVLCALHDMNHVDLQFVGNPGPESMCYVKMKESIITYFEDQDRQEQDSKSNNFHDYKVQFLGALASGIIGFIIGHFTK